MFNSSCFSSLIFELFPSREVLEKYTAALYDLVQFLGSKLMEGLGLNGGDLFKDWLCQMKMNRYNYSPETVGTTGAVLHSDAGFITILQDDEVVNGLEAVDEVSGEFISVDPIPGTLLVNVGDVAKVPYHIYEILNNFGMVGV